MAFSLRKSPQALSKLKGALGREQQSCQRTTETKGRVFQSAISSTSGIGGYQRQEYTTQGEGREQEQNKGKRQKPRKGKVFVAKEKMGTKRKDKDL